jgi:outer membrane lipoprotein SlyB
MERKLLSMALAIILVVTLAGCAANGGYDPGRSAAAGALGGAATGAALGSIIGAATGSAATGAWVGAAAGALAGGIGGYLYANHMNNQIRSAELAAQQANYNPSMGNFVNVDRVEVVPPMVRPGQTITMRMMYTVLTPDNRPAPATLVREVRLGGQLMGRSNENPVGNVIGTYQDQVTFGLPQDAPPGTYSVISRVRSPYGNAEREAFFTVQ